MGKLAEKSSFAEFNPLGGIKPNAKKIEEVCSTAGLEDSLKNAWPTMKTEAPQLVTFFSQMLQNRRKNHQSIESITADDEQSGPIYLLAALVLRGYSRNKSSFLREVLGLYMMANGTPRRVIDTVAHLGVVSSYTKLNDLLNVMQDKAKEHIKQVAHDPTGVIVYDNFNFLNQRAKQRQPQRRHARAGQRDEDALKRARGHEIGRREPSDPLSTTSAD
jgi:hypothetical protein